MRGGRASEIRQWVGSRALSPTKRQKKWQPRHPATRQKRRPATTVMTDEHAERQAVIKARSALIDQLKGILQSPPAIGKSAPMAAWL
jgi:hypothetical protein